MDLWLALSMNNWAIEHRDWCQAHQDQGWVCDCGAVVLVWEARERSGVPVRGPYPG